MYTSPLKHSSDLHMNEPIYSPPQLHTFTFLNSNNMYIVLHSLHPCIHPLSPYTPYSYLLTIHHTNPLSTFFLLLSKYIQFPGKAKN